MILKNFIRCMEEISEQQTQFFIDLIQKHEKIIILGNGGSNAIASHISQDYTKKLNKKSFSFSDPSRLTCYINDYGMEKAYEQFLKEFCETDTLVILISSSGESKNILNCAKYCLENNIKYIILTGFSENNSLRRLYKQTSCFDLWINSSDYGIVECSHQAFLHAAA